MFHQEPAWLCFLRGVCSAASNPQFKDIIVFFFCKRVLNVLEMGPSDTEAERRKEAVVMALFGILVLMLCARICSVYQLCCWIFLSGYFFFLFFFPEQGKP